MSTQQCYTYIIPMRPSHLLRLEERKKNQPTEIPLVQSKHIYCYNIYCAGTDDVR